MKIFNDFNKLATIKNPVLTIGTFDGVHVGHQKIIQQLNTEAKKLKGESVLFTFYPHPRMVLNPTNHGLKLIQTQEEKLEKLKEYGLDNLIVIPFTNEFSNLSAEDFVKKYLVDQLNVKKVVIGYDHQFGKNREGGIEFLKAVSTKYAFDVIEITAEEINEVNISSTRIRKAIEKGDLKTANEYLGDPFQLNGIVVEGKKLGRTIGYPTANIQVNSDLKIIPDNGVYFVNVKLRAGENYYGMLNIGYRPTVSDEHIQTIEVNLFDFNNEIYNEAIQVSFISKLRDEKKFKSIDELTIQLQEDEKKCRSLINPVHQ